MPWLPIKQGQSLNRHRDTGDDGTPAVVLTLRKKYSVHRETLRQPSQASNDSSSSAEQALSPGGEQIAPSDRSVLGNPWEDAPPRPRPRPHGHRQTGSAHVRHRLSFDAASGVIMLPEDEDWMEEDAGDSDSDDYGDLQNSTLSEVGPRDSPGVEGGYQATAGSPGHGKRYSTYYHHPERRRQPPASSPPQ